MTYEEAIEYIHSINWCFCKPGLERVSELCRRLGDPQKSLKFLHVAGTNGKGSFCSMIESVLRAAGYKTGLYTSPYIVDFCERMRVCGENIPKNRLAELTERIRPIADSMADKPTEFELITALAFEYFKEEGCEIVVLETGLGGRLDSTNIIEEPVMSVITGIALDHTAILGNSIEEIAAEKAGIIKKGRPVLFGGESEEAGKVIAKKAAEMGSRLVKAELDRLENIDADLLGSSFDYRERKGVKISLLGLYQPKNAALVLDGVDMLRECGLSLPEWAVREGLLSAKWPARFEVIGKEPLTIFDGAHNPQGVSEAVRSIKHYFGDKKVCVLAGVLRDKDYRFIARSIAEVAEQVITITPESERALDGGEFAEVIRACGAKAEFGGDIEEAYKKAKEYAKKRGIALVCLGSLYLYVSIRGVMGLI